MAVLGVCASFCQLLDIFLGESARGKEMVPGDGRRVRRQTIKFCERGHCSHTLR